MFVLHGYQRKFLFFDPPQIKPVCSILKLLYPEIVAKENILVYTHHDFFYYESFVL